MTSFPWLSRLVRFAVPKSRRGRFALAVALALVSLCWCAWYKPWETHYHGRPSSYWARILIAEHAARRRASATSTFLTSLENWFDRQFGSSRFDSGDLDFAPILVELLKHPDSAVRQAAAEDLCEQGAGGFRQALPTLLDTLLRNPKLEERQAAIRAIHFNIWKDMEAVRSAIPELLKCYEAETDPTNYNSIIGILRTVEPQATKWPPMEYEIDCDTPAGNETDDRHLWPLQNPVEGDGSVCAKVSDPSAPLKTDLVFALSADRSPLSMHVRAAAGYKIKNLETRVYVKAVTGGCEQGGGVLWRLRGPNYYYAAGINPLDNSLRLYKVGSKGRVQLGCKDGLNLTTGKWYALTVKHMGDRIECSIDGVRHLEIRDVSLFEPGTFGFWTMGEAQTYFDGLRVADFGD
jgi:HEAT repeats